MTRREFVLATVACSCAVAQGEATTEPSRMLDVGVPADYPADGPYDKFAKSDKILILRTVGKIVAASAVCTHRSCILKVDEGSIRCPCHGSQFSNQGAVTKGPATGALPRYAIRLEDGQLKVDRDTMYPEKQWDDAGSFVRIA